MFNPSNFLGSLQRHVPTKTDKCLFDTPYLFYVLQHVTKKGRVYLDTAYC